MTKTDTNTLIVLIGPTGVGKTELSLRLAEAFHTCILSADSRQLYADLPIGTAAPTPEQLSRVKHYFVGTLALTDYYSAAQYEADALRLLGELFATRPVVVLTGGSMMYVDAICKGIDDIPTVDTDTRQLLLHKYETEGLEHLCDELRLMDPEYYRIVDRKNPKRVIHALEICYMTGRTYTSFRTQTQKERPFRIVKVGLVRDREELYDRINRRVDQMMADGLLDEAEHRGLQGTVQIHRRRMDTALRRRENQAELAYLFAQADDVVQARYLHPLVPPRPRNGDAGLPARTPVRVKNRLILLSRLLLTSVAL